MLDLKNEQERKTAQIWARHQQLLRLLADINADMAICKLENWDVMEYSKMIRDEMAGIIHRYEMTKDCKGRPFKKYEESPRCGRCEEYCAFYTPVCPECGAKLDRSNKTIKEVKHD